MLTTVLIVVIAFGAQSQPPAEGTANHQQNQQQQPGAQTSGPDTSSQQGTTNVIVNVQAPNKPADTNNDARASDEQDKKSDDNSGNWWTQFWDAVAAVGTIAQAFFAFMLLGLTLVLAGIAYQQWKTTKEQGRILDATLTANKIIERAYVALTHHPPGIDPRTEVVQGEPTRWKHHLVVRIKVQNHGNTPARITRSLVQVVLTNDALRDVPEYEEGSARSTHVHLVKNDHYTISTPYEVGTKGEEFFDAAFREMARDGHRLYVIGYVDYIDKFGQRHRCGYGRMYEPSIDDRSRPEYRSPVHGQFDLALYLVRSNLILMREPNYNYDRERKKGEGNDWDEPERSRATSEG